MRLLDSQVEFGCDPEIFVTTLRGKRRAVVASEMIVPPTGFQIVRDGVQLELHPTSTQCRATLSNTISGIFMTLDLIVKAKSKELKDGNLRIDFNPVFRLTPGDMKPLSDVAKQLGCMPSKNAYGRKHIQKDGSKYLLRSAAGHIHLGYNKADIPDTDLFAKMLDLWVGNTGVLLDRHPLNAERRKTYGRAGEYRTPAHGFEYRTLSNFWLKNYVLMSLLFAQARNAFQVMVHKDRLAEKIARKYYFDGHASSYYADPVATIMSRVDLKQLETAINTNDFDLAWKNYTTALLPFIKETYLSSGLQKEFVAPFEHFVMKIRAAELAGNPDPLSVWFPMDSVEHWKTKGDGHYCGWESFAAGGRLGTEYRKSTQIKSAIVTPPSTWVAPADDFNVAFATTEGFTPFPNINILEATSGT